MSQTNIIKGIYNTCYKSWIPNDLCVHFEYKDKSMDTFDEIEKFLKEVLFIEVKNFFLKNLNELNCDTYVIYLDPCSFQTTDSSNVSFSMKDTVEINNQKVCLVAETENWIHAKNFTATYCEIIRRKPK